MPHNSETAPPPPLPPRKASIFILQKGELFIFCFALFWLVLYTLAGWQSGFSALFELLAGKSDAGTEVKLFLFGFFGVFSLAAISYMFAWLPVWVVFDSRAGEIRRRAFLRTVESISLDDVDWIYPAYDLKCKYFRYVLAFRKDWLRQPQMLSYPFRSFGESEGFRGKSLHDALEILHAHKQKHPERAPTEENAGRVVSMWRYIGERRYLFYPFFIRYFVISALLLGALCLAEQWKIIEKAVLALSDGDAGLPPRVTHYAFMGAFGLMAADPLLSFHYLRFDPETNVLYRCRLLGLWRQRFDFSRFEGFFLQGGFDDPGLYMRFRDRNRPVPFFLSRSPEKLRRALLSSAAAFGVDPWEKFTAHGKIAEW